MLDDWWPQCSKIYSNVMMLTKIKLMWMTLHLFNINAEVHEAYIMQHIKSINTGETNLYPQATETRDLRVLDGIWNFRVSPSDQDIGFKQKWFRNDLYKSGPVIPMPVPASYNDVGEDAALRDHVGLVWYDRRFHVPPSWLTSGQRAWLRFSSVHYAAQVWVNGKSMTSHEIGHLPFEVEITDVVTANRSNLLTVVVDNMLLSETVPQGSVNTVFDNDQEKLEQSYTFDFFNYAGIHRSVYLYSTPKIYIADINARTTKKGSDGLIIYKVIYKPVNVQTIQCVVRLLDKTEKQVANSQLCVDQLEVSNANFWWPYLMDPNPGYMYTMEVSLIGNHGKLLDKYRLKVGIRTLNWTKNTIFINSKPIYLRGFGMHEDSNLRGKGWDPVLWVKNFNLIRWVGANAFRTSHYPYAEEIYQLADDQGIMVIDECPGVNTEGFSDALLVKHKQSLTELIRRDKNHPSVIMWSVANEPQSQMLDADSYFRSIVHHVKTMDSSRPLTAAVAQYYSEDNIGKHLDVISFNRYNAWYSQTGQLSSIANNVVEEAEAWYGKYKKPVIMAEYGADTIPGLHLLPEYVWSEEYQLAFMSEHFRAFDYLRKTGFFVGEFIWNFADFNTAQTYTRVGGNKKGIFTRERQPKASAHHLRMRYHQLAEADGGVNVPQGVSYYVSDKIPSTHQEL